MGEDYEFQGFTEIAKKILGKEGQVFIIGASGPTGVGKSTKLNQLFNPKLIDMDDDEEIEANSIFKTGDGPNPVTGYERDHMNFPCSEGMKLSTFCELHGIPVEENDKQISLFLVDSQGTGSIKDDDVGTVIAMTILTAAFYGVRFCFANGPRPNVINYGEVDGSLDLNSLVQKEGSSSSGCAIGVIYRDVYNKKKERKMQIQKDNEEYTRLWIEHNNKLSPPTDFRLWLFESPVNVEGYKSSIKEVAEWIAYLARKKKKSIQSIQALVDKIGNYINNIITKDDFNIEKLKNFDTSIFRDMVMANEIIPLMDETFVFIEQRSRDIVNTISEKDILDINEEELKNTLFNDAQMFLIKKANDIWGNFENEFPHILKDKSEIIKKQTDFAFLSKYNERRLSILNEIEGKIIVFSNDLIDNYIQKSKIEIQNISFEQILKSDVSGDQIKKWINNASNDFDSQIPKICLSNSIQKNQLINKTINEKRTYVSNQIKFSFNLVFYEQFTKAQKFERDAIVKEMESLGKDNLKRINELNSKLDKKNDQIEDSNKKMDQMRKDFMLIREKEHEKNLKMMKEIEIQKIEMMKENEKQRYELMREFERQRNEMMKEYEERQKKLEKIIENLQYSNDQLKRNAKLINKSVKINKGATIINRPNVRVPFNYDLQYLIREIDGDMATIYYGRARCGKVSTKCVTII